MTQTKQNRNLEYFDIYDEKLENQLLGSLILNPKNMPEVGYILYEDSFYTPINQFIFSLLYKRMKTAEPIDTSLVLSDFKRSKFYDAQNGKDEVWFFQTYITNSTFADPVVQFARRLAEYKMSRMVFDKSFDWISKIKNNESIGQILQDINVTYQTIISNAISSDTMRHISDVMMDSKVAYENRVQMALEGKKSGIYTGLYAIDNVTGGFQPGDVVVVAARPSIGKTSFALHLAKMASFNGSVAVFSLETKSRKISDKFILGASDINSQDYKLGNPDTIENISKEFSNAYSELCNLPIYIDDNYSITGSYIDSQLWKLKTKHGKISAVMIDFLQLMEDDTNKFNREQQIATISRNVKMMAKKYECTFFELSQLNRECEKRADKKPAISDLRESGALEQDADIIMLLHREARYFPESEKVGIMEINIAKNKEGECGIIEIGHNETMTKFYDSAPELAMF